MKTKMQYLLVAVQAGAVIFAAGQAAALTWSRVNSVSPGMIGLYHITNDDTSPFQLVETAAGLPDSVNMIVQEPTEGPGVTVSSDVPASFFGPYSLKLAGIQRIQTLDGLSNEAVSGSHSAEIWFKWDNSMTSSSFTFGFGGGATALIARDVTNPANDQFGVRSGHGDYIAAPGFTSWQAWDTTAPLGNWHHVAYAIESPGSTPGEGDHNIYLPGSIMRLWINNELVGTVDISGEENHQAARPHIRTFGGDNVYVDEFVLWDHDVSLGGVEISPFSDGRGSASAEAWQLFE